MIPILNHWYHVKYCMLECNVFYFNFEPGFSYCYQCLIPTGAKFGYTEILPCFFSNLITQQFKWFPLASWEILYEVPAPYEI